MNTSDGFMLRRHDGSLAVNVPLGAGLKILVVKAAKKTGASHAFLLLCDYDSQELHNVAWYGNKEISENCFPVAQWVLSKGESVCLHEESDARQIVGSSPGMDALPLICAPVMTNAGPRGVLGVGSLNSDVEDFSYWLAFLESMAELVSALLEVTALQETLSNKEEQLRTLIKNTLNAQETERERICFEIHDGVAQTLVSAFNYLQGLENLLPEGTSAGELAVRTKTLLKQSIRELREVIGSLQPAILRNLGLITTLRQEMQQLEQDTGWKVDFGTNVIELPEDIETGLYRIIHEAINNARKHTDTERLYVSINSNNGQVKVEVRDWGNGFSRNAERVSKGQRAGLLSMRKRAEFLQGTCDIQSIPGRGTVVCIKVPVNTS